MKMETPTTPTARPAIVTGRQLCSAGMVKEAKAASNHSTAPARITGRGSNSAAGNAGGSVPDWQSGWWSGIAITVADRRWA